jgi:hypothetical protein
VAHGCRASERSLQGKGIGNKLRNGIPRRIADEFENGIGITDRRKKSARLNLALMAVTEHHLPSEAVWLSPFHDICAIYSQSPIFDRSAWVRATRATCDDTFRYALKHVEVKELEKRLGEWTKERTLRANSQFQGVSIDGKSLRGSGEARERDHLVASIITSLFVHRYNLNLIKSF